MSKLFSPVGNSQLFDNDGKMLSGGSITVYKANTLNLATIYANANGGALTNPIVLNASGRIPNGQLFLDMGKLYDIVVKKGTTVLESYADVSGLFDSSVGVIGSVTVDYFAGTGNQTVYNLSSPPGDISVTTVVVDGLTITPVTDYTLTGNVLRFVVAPSNGAEIVVRYNNIVAVEDSSLRNRKYDRWTTASNQLNYTLSKSPGSQANMLVFLDGITLIPSLDYTWTSSAPTTLTLLEDPGASKTLYCSYGDTATIGVGGSSDSDSVEFQPDGNGAVITTVENKLRESVSVFDFMSSAQVASIIAGTGAIVDDEIEDAITYAAGRTRLHFPAGKYITTREIKVLSNSFIYGDGIGHTIVTRASGYATNQNGFTNSQNTHDDNNQGNENIVIKDLEIVGAKGLTNGSSIGSGTTGCGIGLAYVTNALIENVFSRDWSKHCFDVSAKYYWPEDPIGHPDDYVPGPSSNVTLRNCSATNSGDDLITTHFSSAITIENPHCYGALSSEEVGNRNGVEIDDGSYDVLVLGGLVENCNSGIEIKAHWYAPAATRVRVYGTTIRRCARGINIRHMRFYGENIAFSATASINNTTTVTFETWPVDMAAGMLVSGAGIVTGTRVTAIDEVAKTITISVAATDSNTSVLLSFDNQYRGYSKTAKDVLIHGVTIYSPQGVASGALLPRAIRIASYDGVRVVGLTVIQTDDTLPDEGESDETAPTSSPIYIHQGAKNVVIEGLSVRNYYAATESIVRITNSSRNNVKILNARFDECKNVPAIYNSSSSGGMVIDTIDAVQTGTAVPVAVLFSFTPENIKAVISNINTSGYTYASKVSGFDTYGTTDMNWGTVSRWVVADSSVDASTIPQEAMSIGWAEGSSQNLGAGDGVKYSFKMRLNSNNTIYENAWIGSYKENNNDNETGTALQFATRGNSDSGTGSTVRWEITPFGTLRCLGSGNPEGVVKASRGALWCRTDSTSGNSLYIKETGDNTTSGWAKVTTTPA